MSQVELAVVPVQFYNDTKYIPKEHLRWKFEEDGEYNEFIVWMNQLTKLKTLDIDHIANLDTFSQFYAKTLDKMT